MKNIQCSRSDDKRTNGRVLTVRMSMILKLFPGMSEKVVILLKDSMSTDDQDDQVKLPRHFMVN